MAKPRQCGCSAQVAIPALVSVRVTIKVAVATAAQTQQAQHEKAKPGALSPSTEKVLRHAVSSLSLSTARSKHSQDDSSQSTTSATPEYLPSLDVS